MKVLITGSNGQLGSEIKSLAGKYVNLEFIFKNLSELDICEKGALEILFQDQDINAVINCAAYTAVDKAEGEFENVRKVNFGGVSNLDKAIGKVSGKMIHISTDYVFNGDHSVPYIESDQVSPIGVYGKTKREGELAILSSEIDAIVIRTSWLYSAYGNNFVKTMLKLGKERDELGVISDQIGTPTNARDLAKTCLDILTFNQVDNLNQKGNLYHYSNEGVASWYDFAMAIMDLGKLTCKLKPIQTEDYPTLARRPHYSVLAKTKIKDDFAVEIPYWRDSLKTCIERIKKGS